MTPTSRRQIVRLLRCLTIVPVFFSVGCGYMVGSFHGSDVQTVAVPVFETNSTRRGIEYQLTEAVQNEIKARTPFRIAKEPYADTRLKGRIIDIRKRPVSETRFDDPRELQYSLAVQVVWEDLRTGNVLAEQTIPIDPVGLHLESKADFAPELGQSQASANQRAVQDLAAQIVDRMEAPW